MNFSTRRFRAFINAIHSCDECFVLFLFYIFFFFFCEFNVRFVCYTMKIGVQMPFITIFWCNSKSFKQRNLFRLLSSFFKMIFVSFRKFLFIYNFHLIHDKEQKKNGSIPYTAAFQSHKTLYHMCNMKFFNFVCPFRSFAFCITVCPRTHDNCFCFIIRK